MIKTLIFILLFCGFSYSQEYEKILYFRDTIISKEGQKTPVTIKVTEQELIQSTIDSMQQLDSLSYLKTISIFAMDSINHLRIKSGSWAVPLDEQYFIDFMDESVEYYMDSVKVPILVKTIIFDRCNYQECHEEIIEEIFSYKEIKERLLSKKASTFRIVIFHNDRSGTNYCIETHKLLFSISVSIKEDK